MNPIGGRIVRLTISVSMTLLSFDVAVAQTVAKAAAAKSPVTSTYMPPRTPDGQPDISGMYEPGWIGQPAETAVGGQWRPPTPKGGQAIWRERGCRERSNDLAH
jgi:hypothetical protein